MSKLLLATVFLTLLSVGYFFPMSTCPNEENLFPCSCKRLAFGLQVKCANFNTSSHLLRVFRILRDYQVNTVLLHGLYIPGTLPSELFTGMKVKEIKVEKSKLIFAQPAFSGLDPYLQILNVAQESKIKSQERFSLAKLSKLNELSVKSSHMEKVEDKWLNEKVPNVNRIQLDDNDITLLEDHAFAKLKSLKLISLSDNRIKVIKRSMFPKPALHLIRIDLTYNEISELPSDLFFDMPNLKEIALSHNEIKTLPEATWTPVWRQLTQIILFENQLDCGDGMKWITRYPEPNQLEGTCSFPKKMNGKSVRELYTQET